MIKNGTLLLDGETSIKDGCIIIENGKIVGIYKGDMNIVVDKVIDAEGNYIVPGLLDMHTHGAIGHDFNICTKDEVQDVAKALLKEGVTGFLASLVAESHADTIAILKRFEACTAPSMIGIHLEGPYLNINKKAVMKEKFLRNPDLDEFNEFNRVSSKIKSMTMAPELPGAHEMMMTAVNRGIIVNIGHSDATCEQTLLAQEYGATGITHLYNAMTQHEHRAPGMVTGAILSNLYCELIVDGFHVHPDIVKSTYQMIGKKRIILITDANPCKGLPDGEYPFSGNEVIIKDGHARVKQTGRIAGSTLCLHDACKAMMKWCGCSMQDVLQMAAVNPGEQYHLSKGKLKLGYDGDALIVNKDFDILHVFQNDQLVF